MNKIELQNKINKMLLYNNVYHLQQWIKVLKYFKKNDLLTYEKLLYVKGPFGCEYLNPYPFLKMVKYKKERIAYFCLLSRKEIKKVIDKFNFIILCYNINRRI